MSPRRITVCICAALCINITYSYILILTVINSINITYPKTLMMI